MFNGGISVTLSFFLLYPSCLVEGFHTCTQIKHEKLSCVVCHITSETLRPTAAADVTDETSG